MFGMLRHVPQRCGASVWTCPPRCVGGGWAKNPRLDHVPPAGVCIKTVQNAQRGRGDMVGDMIFVGLFWLSLEMYGNHVPPAVWGYMLVFLAQITIPHSLEMRRGWGILGRATRYCPRRFLDRLPRDLYSTLVIPAGYHLQFVCFVPPCRLPLAAPT